LNEFAADTYCSRFCKVLEYIDSHLDDDLTIDRLSTVAAFSKYHFHRQFSELFGISVYKYVRLTRLKRASYQLAFRDPMPIVDISLANGYENHESFSRAFKKNIGQTPSEFRERPQWNPWHLIYQPLSDLRIEHMKPDNQLDNVKVTMFKETKVAVLEHRGDPNLIRDSIRKFIEWRKQNHLLPQVSDTFNILYDNPSEVSPENFRLDICASTDRDVTDNSFGVVEKTLPGGRCAVWRYIGDEANLGESITYLYSNWLPLSGEEPRDFPLFLQRVKFFPDVPEHETVIDVFLPLK
jgi:AraC family transcriptional regulator